MSGFYEFQLTLLVLICVLVLVLERWVSSSKIKKPLAASSLAKEYVDDSLENGRSHTRHGSNGSVSGMASARESALNALMRKYLVVYAIVMGADWLQGPYVYSLYREQYAFPEHVVAVLFVIGFVSAGLSAPLVGVWADQYGRRRLCLFFCVAYTLTCGFLLIPFLPLLLVGRVLGGISTSILFSAFESWLVSASSTAALHSEDLSSIMGRATLVNGFVATAAGVFSNKLVEWNAGGFRSPFVASGVLLILGWIVIHTTWGENYGSGGGAQASTEDIFQIKRLGTAWRIVAADPTLLVLGLTQTIFEGSMYLFVFIWVPALQESSSTPSALPLGYIFSSFMISMMLGSLLYTFIASHWHRPAPPHVHTLSAASASSSIVVSAPDSTLVLHAKLSSLVCAVSALAFAAGVHAGNGQGGQSEKIKFWAFCVFEACVGMYYPVQGMLRGSLISNEHRATLSALFRVPLNIFVVVSLLTGLSSARNLVFTACALVLGVSALTTAAVVLPRVEALPLQTNGRTA
ncbi:hypothetical protein EW146_g7769 [Bondarzewia mesenterica]|uniref:Molybdate-anion transporter n=1 Tax=Bondarzewia mesenterica TaxID=1095465 RepID=A0A4S4LLH5_9AGAM|nr:hypothetical protein EW146_g7769 [Bondarzewia mesenterica]